jgi:hypothetical protein
MYGLVCQELQHVAPFTFTWTVQFRNSYDATSSMSVFFVIRSRGVDLYTKPRLFRLYDGHGVELVVFPVDNTAASAPQLTCLQLPTPDALTRSGDFGGHIQRSTSGRLRARAYLDLVAFCTPSPPDYMRVI